jgi:hypothetical protein
VQYRFEPGACIAIAKYLFAQSRPIERSIGTQQRIAKRIEHSGVARLTRSRQRVGDGVGVRDLDAKSGEAIGHHRFAAADSAGETDHERHVSREKTF